MMYSSFFHRYRFALGRICHNALGIGPQKCRPNSGIVRVTQSYHAALKSLGAYKLTGNFPVDLEIVLKDLRVLDKIIFEIEPKTLLSDTRHVQFRPADEVQLDRIR